MVKTKIKKTKKKSYASVDDDQIITKRSLRRKNKTNVNFSSVDDYKLRQAIEGGA